MLVDKIVSCDPGKKITVLKNVTYNEPFFKTVVNNYERTIYVEEALHRLVELHYKLGMISEAQKYASLLGYNYKSSEWYKKSYKIFNQDYQDFKKTNKKKNKKLIDRIRSFF